MRLMGFTDLTSAGPLRACGGKAAHAARARRMHFLAHQCRGQRILDRSNWTDLILPYKCNDDVDAGVPARHEGREREASWPREMRMRGLTANASSSVAGDAPTAIAHHLRPMRSLLMKLDRRAGWRGSHGGDRPPR